MDRVLLEEVFKLSGIPTHTFVRPPEFGKLLVALRSPGRGVVVEGPSGIGKTTAVTRALDELGILESPVRLSARKQGDRELIAALPEMRESGTVVIDDFHRLEEATRRAIADFLKTLADEERTDTKLIIVGINRAGESLISFSRDLAGRIDTIPFEVNPDEKVRELIEKGEIALQVTLNTKSDIVAAAHGSFYIAQMLCHETCLAADVMERQPQVRAIEISLPVVKSRVMQNLQPKFMDVAIKFATGPKLRRAGRAPYLHILKWLSEANEWSISLDREIASHKEHRGSVGQVVDKGYLDRFLRSDPEFTNVLHFDPSTRVLTVEDPQFVYFLRNLGWSKFSQRVGYINTHFPTKYDFALSFAGSDRAIAERLFNILEDLEFEVFYDKNEQHRILATDVEEYLAPIYASEARYVVCLLGPEYPKRIWTKIESDAFRGSDKTGFRQ